MTCEGHWRGLERVYLAAPINECLSPTIDIGDGKATINLLLSERMHHSARAVHGSIYFKMLDEAAFFAASSLEREAFLLTTTFNLYLTRPVSEGKLRAEGRVVNQNRSQIVAEAVVFNDDGKAIGRGSGIFARSRIRLEDLPGYLEKQSL